MYNAYLKLKIYNEELREYKIQQIRGQVLDHFVRPNGYVWALFVQDEAVNPEEQGKILEVDIKNLWYDDGFTESFGREVEGSWGARPDGSQWSWTPDYTNPTQGISSI